MTSSPSSSSPGLFDLGGQIAFVTGAGSGIGQRIAVGLAEAGADVACFDLPGHPQIEETLARIRALGRRAIALEGDVVKSEDLGRAVEAAERQLGPIEVAVNCAGIANAAPAEDMAEAQWQQVMSINLDGVFRSCQAEARVMLPRKRGTIVNIASMSGTIVNRGIQQVHYNTSKAGVVHLTKCLAVEWSDRGVRVNSISPGYTLTPQTVRPDVPESKRQQFAADTPLGRMANVDELVGPAVFLSSRAASYCTGLDLLVDGGFVCW